MSLIFSLPSILEESRKLYDDIMQQAASGKPFYPVEKTRRTIRETDNLLARGDNLEFMRYLLQERNMAGKIQLVYVDPPFYSRANYDAVIKLKSPLMPDAPAMKPAAYRDVWEGGIENYLRMLCVRFFLIRDLLAKEGCLWVHLDWHAAHSVKLLLDAVFGEKNFINEIIWNYKSGGTGKRSFSRKHDTLLFYSKSRDYHFQPLKEKSYNRGYRPYCFKNVKEYRDELGWYTEVNMKDVWQIDMVGRTSSERTGYATQKPEALLSRIVESCSRKGDLCADFFGGSGTLAAVAEKTGRPWISCDMGEIATVSCMKRLFMQESAFTLMSQEPDRAGEALSLELAASAAGAGERTVAIKLKGYKPDMDNILLKAEDRKVAEAFCRADPIQLLEYWSVDFHYDGKIHRPEFYFLKNRDQIEKSCCRTGRGMDRISVRAADVFGNSIHRILYP